MNPTLINKHILINQLEKLATNAPIEDVIQIVIDSAKLTKEGLEDSSSVRLSTSESLTE